MRKPDGRGVAAADRLDTPTVDGPTEASEDLRTPHSPDLGLAPPVVPAVGRWAGPPEDPARYEVLEVLGRGAEGTTYRAHYVAEPGTEPVVVALKAYEPPAGCSPHWPHDGTWRQITLQRTLLAALPPNAHVVQIRDAFLGSSSGTGAPDPPATAPPGPWPFVVMPWVSGLSPDALLAAAPSPALHQRLGWAADLMAALRSLHSVTVHAGNSLVHGDVKPANCLIDGAGRLVLLDLGAAVHVANRGTLRGLHTPGFAAPEVCADPRGPRTPASDLYSLGATVVVLLTGGPAPPSVHSGLTGGSPGAGALREGLRRDLRRLPRRSRNALAEDVIAMLDTDPAARRAPSPVTWRRAAARVRTQNRRRLLGAVAAATTACGAVGTLAALPTIPGVSSVQTTQTVVTPPELSRTAADRARTTPAPGAPAGAVDSTALTLRWDLLAEAPPLPGARAVLDAALPEAAGAWTTASPAGESHATSSGLSVPAGRPGQSNLVAAPGLRGAAHESVTAAAVSDSGQGFYGVWCRGDGSSNSPRYRFMLSHASAARISEVSAGADGAQEPGTGWWWLTGLDTRDGVTVEGHCTDTSSGVRLDMLVNGREVLSYRPQQSLGPAGSGVEAEAFVDVSTPPLTATFTRFADASGA